MAFSRTWDSSYEALPGDDDVIPEGPTRIRNTRIDVRERMAIDHSWSGTANDGKHNRATLIAVVAPSAPTGAEGILFYDTADSALKFLRSSGAAISLTKAGGIAADNFAAGTRMLFVQAAAPTGWTQDVSQNDKVLRLVSGTGYVTGGSWTISGISVDGHAITEAEMPAHTHGISFNLLDNNNDNGSLPAAGQDGNVVDVLNETSASTGSGNTHTHTLTIGNSWRPAYMDVIAATKNA